MVDIAALKAKLDNMNNRGQGKTQLRSDLWKPDYGKYQIRPVPWPFDVDSNTAPFIERWFYYGLDKRAIAPKLGQPDPVRELRDVCFERRTESDLTLARELKPKMRVFLPVIVEEEGEKSVKIWGMSQTVYKELLSIIVDPDYGDFTDPEKGHDLTVEIVDSGKKFGDGRPIKDINVRPRPKPRTLSKDEKALLNEVPDINTIYPVSTYDELAGFLERKANGAPTGVQESRGGDSHAGSKPPVSSGSEGSLEDAFKDLLS